MLGERLRDLLLDAATGELDPRTELLLMAAARAEHVARVIRPALDAGRDVVCDRFSASSVAYQAYGRGLAPGEVARVSRWATGGLEPDLVVLLDLDATTRAARLGGDHDRLEAAGETFHERVSQAFRDLADDRTRITGSSSTDRGASTSSPTRSPRRSPSVWAAERWSTGGRARIGSH